MLSQLKLKRIQLQDINCIFLLKFKKEIIIILLCLTVLLRIFDRLTTIIKKFNVPKNKQ